MRRIKYLPLVIAIWLVAQPALAQQESYKLCLNQDGSYSWDQQINGCAAAIQSGQWEGKNLAAVYYHRAIAYYEKEIYDLAISDYSQAIRLDPNYTTIYFKRGLAYYKKRDYDHAVRDYSETIRLDPKDVFALYNRGRAYQAKQDYDHAVRDYNETIRLDPKDAYAFYYRGNAFQA
jgi:tetratricopeptide (TPR) repeat protein